MNLQIAATAFLCGWLQACTISQPRQASGLVQVGYNNYASSGIVIGPSVILSAAHVFPDRSIDLSSILINDMSPSKALILADGWEEYRQMPESNLSSIHSHAVFEDYLLFHTNLVFAPTTFTIPDDLPWAIRVANKIELVTQSKVTLEEAWLKVRDVFYDLNHNVIAISLDNTEFDAYYLSGSPLVARHKDGSGYLVGIVSASATVPINGVRRANMLLVCPIDVIPFEEISREN